MLKLRAFFRRYQTSPVLEKRAILLLALPALGWAWVFRSRKAWMSLECGKIPENCPASELWAVDRFTIELGSRTADVLSDWGQNFSGILAAGVPLLLTGWIITRSRSLRLALPQLRLYGVEFLLLLEATLWNGFINEAVRSWVQRPRPFVYLNPVKHGFSAAHYTSFYSGHTSFAALAGVSLVLALYSRRAPGWAVKLGAITALLLTIMTGTGRVLSARHFPTDVIAGALIGALIALVIGYLHRVNSGFSARAQGELS